MDFRGVIEKAQDQWHHTDDKDCTTVYVAAAFDRETANSLVGLFEDWAKETIGKGRTIRTGSFGYYDLEPIVVIKKPKEPAILYCGITEEVASQLKADCLKKDGRRPDLAFCSIGEDRVEGIPRASEVPMLALQSRIALRNCGLIDPESVHHYIAAGQGYAGLAKALQMDRAGLLKELRDAALRDRSGEGRLTADAWQLFLNAPMIGSGSGSGKVVVCNTVDGDARGRTARLLLDSDPHTVLEGLLIAAYGVGASRCIVCVAQGGEAAGKRLVKLVGQLREYGLLGVDILDSGFDCEIEIGTVPRSLVVLDDSALLGALEGRQAIPDLHNGRPAGRFGGKETLVCDVETLANLPAILEKGSSWFAKIGSRTWAGSKVISLSGDASHLYTVEVPFGTHIDSIISTVGGGAKNSAPIKTARLGGPTAAYLGRDELKRALGCGSACAGPDMSSGVLEVVSEENCGVEMTAKVISYLQHESCGKCLFCREGTLQMYEALKDIVQGDGANENLDFLIDLARAMMEGSLCDLGRNAGRPVASSISLFRPDFDAHIKEKKCPKS